MAEPFNVQIHDEIVKQEMQGLRLAEGEYRNILAMLNELEQKILGQLTDKSLDPTEVSRPPAKEARREKLSLETAALVSAIYFSINQILTPRLTRIGVISGQETIDAVNRLFGFNALRPTMIQERIAELILQPNIAIRSGSSASMADWWQRQSRDLQRLFDDVIAQGIRQNAPIGELVRRIRGTRARRFRDGIMEISRRNARTLARTAVLSIQNQARLDVYQRNPDIVRAIASVPVLDSRTSLICISRARSVWRLSDGAPLHDNMPQERFPGAPPWHANCRTTIAPVIRSFQDLSRRARSARNKRALRELIDERRALLDGKPPISIRLTQVAARLGDSAMLNILGRKRFDLWKSGRIELHRLIDGSGRPITLENLID